MPGFVRTWPSLTDLPALYPDARNRQNRGPLLYQAGRVWPLTRPLDLSGRLALLAVGSNSYPRQLLDKFADDPAYPETDLQGVPITASLVFGYDVAYCPVRSRKGYIPVTLAQRPGAVGLVWLQWLTEQQLDLISQTEGSRYALVGGAKLADRLELDPRLPRPQRVYAWWFDSVLVDGESVVWLDAANQRDLITQPSFPSRAQAIPPGWETWPRPR